MKTLFVTCVHDGLSKDGSARVRAEWICQHWSGAEVYNYSQSLAGYELYVFQKAYLTDWTRALIGAVARWRDAGRCRLAFDLCDPDFLSNEHRRRLLDVLPLFDFAVSPTRPLADWLGQYLPSYVIPDRVDLNEVAAEIGIKQTDSGSSTPSCVWAGYTRHISALRGAMIEAVEALGLNVEIIARDHPLPFAEFWRRVLVSDILLNPRPETGAQAYKSDNKTAIAWSLQQVVARTPDELRALCDPEERQTMRDVCRQRAEDEFDVRQSVDDWIGIAEEWL